MFKVQNADFIADKLSNELLPDQEFREVLKNALEAVERRMRAEKVTNGGRIEFDVDWNLHEQTSHWYMSCADNGDGMNRIELDKYMTTLAVEGAGDNQSITGNQGMGLKISGPTRHKTGIIIRSLKGGERTMVQIGWDGTEYGLIPIGPNDETVIPAPEASLPDLITDQGCGTVVTFLGNTDDDNTFHPAGRPRGWLFKYLHTRFFRLSEGANNGIEVFVRVPTGEEDEWPHSREEASERMRGLGRSFNLSQVNGTGYVWDKAAEKQGSGFHGLVDLPGDSKIGAPQAVMHWWVLPAGPGSDVSSRTNSGGSLAVLFQNELHDWKTSNQANPFFGRLGILFGKSRIAFILEPKGENVTSDFARARVLVGGIPALDSDAWLVWAEQFRERLPGRIRQTMAEEQDRLEVEDPERVRRIRERLKEVMQLLRPRRFRQAQQGRARASGPTVTGPGGEGGEIIEFPTGTKTHTSRRPRMRGIGAVLLEDQTGSPAVEVELIQNLDPKWVTEQESEDFPIVKGNKHGLHDRAAALAGTDGRTAGILLLNRQFRGYQAILATVNEWANPEGDDDKTAKIEAVTQEWIEQKMIEAVEGLRQLENGKTWITEHYDDAMSPVALTAAFMADRYHTLREVKRAAGAFRQTATIKSN